jgi:hypothetical protein
MLPELEFKLDMNKFYTNKVKMQRKKEIMDVLEEKHSKEE